MTGPLLSVRGLTVTFVGSGRPVPAVRGIDFDVHANEVLGIVGESGSGKSVTSLAITGLLDETARVQGSIRLDGVEVTTLDAEYRQMRLPGAFVGMVFRDPTTTSIGGCQSADGYDGRGSRMARSRAARPMRGRWNCCARSTFPTPRAGCTSSRTSSPAACASAR